MDRPSIVPRQKHREWMDCHCSLEALLNLKGLLQREMLG